MTVDVTLASSKVHEEGQVVFPVEYHSRDSMVCIDNE